ncbi:MAG: hypothetical protein LBB16_03060 [Puniceicoccales bacterium]|jgi:hypothetical protein|nr:hypothetical protein [Puniceicoccales bacterium]
MQRAQKLRSIFSAVVLILVVVGGIIPCEFYGYGVGKIVDFSMGFQSKSVTSGRRGLDNNASFAGGGIFGSVGKGEVDFYWSVAVGLNSALAGFESISLGGGIVYHVTDKVFLDLGGFFSRYAARSSSLGGLLAPGVWLHALCIGVAADVILCPSLYFNYNSYGKEMFLEGMVRHYWDLSSLGLRNFMLKFTAEVGCSRSERPYDLPYASTLGKKDYVYYGTAFCLVYRLSRLRANGEAGIGVAYEGNGASKYSWVNCGRNYKNNVWFNAFLDFSF